MTELATFVDRWSKYGNLFETKFIFRVSVTHQWSLCVILVGMCFGAISCGTISVARTLSSKRAHLNAWCSILKCEGVVCVQTERLTFPHGATVLVRCRELGVYKLLGESALQCQNGAWTHRIPACIPTTILTNFTGKYAQVLVWCVCHYSLLSVP
jgi:hypothetical protein